MKIPEALAVVSMTTNQLFLNRCADLGRLGRASVSPNPMVGAVLVAEGRIIGEGYHLRPGQAHAEVNAIAAVKESDRHLIPNSILYVSLEPCNFFGRTPPCTDLIIRNNIKKVVVSSLDYSPEVAGKGLEKLKEHGISASLEQDTANAGHCSLIRNHFVTQNRPFIILKFARSKDGFLGVPGQQKWLSNDLSKRLVHKWRAETDAIMVGTNTALIDNPRLTNRLYFGKSPLRIIPDFNQRLPLQLHCFDSSAPTWIIGSKNAAMSNFPKHITYLYVPKKEQMLQALMEKLAAEQKTSLLVEGGASLIQTFIENDLWDEARIIDTPVYLGKGIAAPQITGKQIQTYPVLNNQITILRNHSFTD